jgi:AhpD family alkylhydroperoxidase
MFLQPMAQHREDVSKDAWHAAHLAGALAEDCGPCVQICVDMATRAGMDPEKLAALIRGDIDDAGPDAAFGFRYGMAVATNADTALSLVEQASRRYGKRGLVSLAFSVTTARMFPTLKRGLGHGAICAKVVVRDETIAVKRAA